MLVAQGTSEMPLSGVVRYFKTDDGAVMEIWTEVESTVNLDGTAWREVTLSELHAAGLKSPSENLNAAFAGNGIVVAESSVLDGFTYTRYSYITCYNNPKRVVLGSVSKRPFLCPGWLRVRGISYCQGEPYYDRFAGWQWGWQCYVQAPPKSYPQVYFWQQKGYHWFTRGQPTTDSTYAQGWF
ncbi:MAG: hypothetical protein ACP5JB_08095 [candidate division WOR-3 bacterium]